MDELRKRAMLQGYVMNKEALTPLAAAAAPAAAGAGAQMTGKGIKAVLEGISTLAGTMGSGAANAVKGLYTGVKDVSTGILNAGTKALPYAAAAPALAGGIGGYIMSQATSPSGEDKEEAMKHLEEQALLQFQADIERQKKVRDYAKRVLLEGGDNIKARQREIRL